MCFLCFLFLLRCLIFDSLYVLPSEESDTLDYESDELGSYSRSSGTYYFHTFSLYFDDSVGSFSVLGSDIFSLTGVEFKGDILRLMCSY